MELLQLVRVCGIVGRYYKDLAQIFDVSHGGDVLMLKLVPRVDYAAEKERNQGDSLKLPEKGVRPLPRLFKRQDVYVAEDLLLVLLACCCLRHQ